MIKPIKHLKPLNIRIPDNLRRQLQAISKKEKIPVSDLVRQSLRQFVAVRHFRQMRRRILPFAEAQGFLTDDDVFGQVS
mgnify:CR=1 FL=1|jgi:predicted transcriptional regulator